MQNRRYSNNLTPGQRSAVHDACTNAGVSLVAADRVVALVEHLARLAPDDYEVRATVGEITVEELALPALDDDPDDDDDTITVQEHLLPQP